MKLSSKMTKKKNMKKIFFGNCEEGKMPSTETTERRGVSQKHKAVQKSHINKWIL